MFKRIMITSVLTVSIALACLSTAAPARATSGFANSIAKTEVLASADNGDVPLPSASAHNKVTLENYSVSRHRVVWTPRKQAMWQIRHHYHGVWNPKNEFRCLNKLWERESGWNKYATNPYSGAYGIPQAEPGYKMASAGANWINSSSTQIKWGLRYIRSRYKLPCHAWAHETNYGWYLVNEKIAKAQFLGKMIVKMAKHIGLPRYTGESCPYVWGGTGPCGNGFDCSGLVYATFHKLGQYAIPRTANDQMNWAKGISEKYIEPGDLVFYGYGGYASHVAIFIGHGKAIEALDFGTNVGIYTVDYPGTPIAYGRVHYHWNPKTKF